MAARSGAQDNRRIDDVSCAADTTELTGGAGTNIIKWFDLDLRRPQQPSQSHLSTSVPPDLPDDSGRHCERYTLLGRARDDRHHGAIVTFEGNQRP